MVRTETDAPVKLRRYRPEDCGKLAELFYETVHFVNAADYTKEQLDVWAPKQRDLAAWNASLLSHYTLVAEMGTEIVGFGDMDENGYLDRLYVRWDCQKRGIAGAICSALERACGRGRFTVCASITAKPFFEKRGYRVEREQEVVRNGIRLTNYRMAKQRRNVMKCTILMGSPRKEGNTIALAKPFMEELKRRGADCSLIWLYDRDIRPCIACRACQKDWERAYCCQEDDMGELFAEILESDLLVLASPIYSWYCTAPMKAALDRLVYAMNKYYGEEKGPSLWAGKRMALITTCGYRPEKGADLWEAGIRRYCKHSQLVYHGMLAERHLGYHTVFMDEGKKQRAVQFAGELWETVKECGEKAEK